MSNLCYSSLDLENFQGPPLGRWMFQESPWVVQMAYEIDLEMDARPKTCVLPPVRLPFDH